MAKMVKIIKRKMNTQWNMKWAMCSRWTAHGTVA